MNDAELRSLQAQGRAQLRQAVTDRDRVETKRRDTDREKQDRRERRRQAVLTSFWQVIVQALGMVVGGAALGTLALVLGLIQSTPRTQLVSAIGGTVAILGGIAGVVLTFRVGTSSNRAAERIEAELTYRHSVARIVHEYRLNEELED